MGTSDATAPRIAALFDRGDPAGCLQPAEAARAAGLAGDEVETPSQPLEERGMSVSDDCGRALRDVARTIAGLDRPVGEEGEATMGDLIEGESPEPWQEMDLSLRESPLHHALRELPDRARQIERTALQRLAAARELEALRDAA